MNQTKAITPGQATTRPLSTGELRGVFEAALDRDTPPAGPARPAADTSVAASAASVLEIGPLMALSDREFVEKAYAGILRRRPDEPGIRHYVASLAAGRSRVMVLGELRYSAEGRAAGTVIPGLRKRFLLHRVYRLKLLGRLLRTVTGIVALPGLVRDMAHIAVELRILRLKTDQADRALERELRSRSDQAERGLEHEEQARREQGDRLAVLASRLEEERWADPLLALADRVEAQERRVDGLACTIEAAASHGAVIATLSEALTAMRQELGWPEQGAALARRFEATLSEQRNIAARAISMAEASRAALQDQERRLSLVIGEMRGWMTRSSPDPEAGAAARVHALQDHLLDPLYVAFEDRFRGSRADIKERQRVYLGLLRESGAGQPRRPIVDVGSGRGELLELFAEEGYAARGVDLNEAMVALCKGAGLDCVFDDAVAYLSRLDAGSLGAVTGFHIIEHLPFTALVGLIDASLHALAPGGIVVFETPNPANLLVSSRWFHLDPTHRNPLPSEMVAMIAEARGFVRVGIRELHPMLARFEAKDEVLAAQLDAIFHGPQDYALIAYKP